MLTLRHRGSAANLRTTNVGIFSPQCYVNGNSRSYQRIHGSPEPDSRKIGCHRRAWQNRDLSWKNMRQSSIWIFCQIGYLAIVDISIMNRSQAPTHMRVRAPCHNRVRILIRIRKPKENQIFIQITALMWNIRFFFSYLHLCKLITSTGH